MDALEIINKTIEEHRFIHSSIGNVKQHANDVNALSRLDWEKSQLAVSSREEFADKIQSLIESLETLHDRLDHHFIFEEENLPQVLDNNRMDSLLVYHRSIRQERAKLDSALAGLKPEELSNSDLLTKKADIVNKITGLSNLIQEHAGMEEVILRNRKKELEGKK
jgi:hypothetical protein